MSLHMQALLPLDCPAPPPLRLERGRPPIPEAASLQYAALPVAKACRWTLPHAAPPQDATCLLSNAKNAGPGRRDHTGAANDSSVLISRTDPDQCSRLCRAVV